MGARVGRSARGGPVPLHTQGPGLYLSSGPNGNDHSCHRQLCPSWDQASRKGRPDPARCRRTRDGTRPTGIMASQLEGAMETLINVFHHYSGKEGDKYKLSKKELKELLQSELGCFLETQKDTGAVEKIMQDLDENGDGEVDFQEYVVLVAALTVACNTFFWENA
uniref:Protein S100-A1 n=1 Tax=Amazona collaria TaxID=241587 RepID=A0A8B9FFH3_9PSIT